MVQKRLLMPQLQGESSHHASQSQPVTITNGSNSANVGTWRRSVSVAILPTPVASASTSAAKTPANKGPGSFWCSEGMGAFVDWITDPHNHEKLNKVRTVSGQKKTDIYEQIAEYVNGIAGTDWNQKIVKSKIDYAKKKYDAARDLAKTTGGGSTENLAELRKQMLELCPEYDRFHAIWGGSLSRNPPPPRESCKRPIEVLSDRESSPETNEADTDTDNDSGSSVTGNNTAHKNGEVMYSFLFSNPYLIQYKLTRELIA